MATLKELYFKGFKEFKLSTYPNKVFTVCSFDERCPLTLSEVFSENWEPVIDKKKKSVTLHRYTIQQYSGEIYQTSWTSKIEVNAPDLFRIIKTETKTLEWEE